MATTRSYPAPEATTTAAEQIMHNVQLKNSYKRKRDSPDRNGSKSRSSQRHTYSSNNIQPNGHELDESPQSGYHNDSSRAGYGIQHHIAQHLAAESSQAAAALAASMPHMTVPQPTELSFPSTGSGGDTERHIDSSFDMGAGSDGDQNQHTQGGHFSVDTMYAGNPNQQPQSHEGGGGGVKPAVGTDEWHKVRKDNHKEVERRRRETINEGINELAKIVPNCEKNKGSILARGVQYITQLRENERTNIEKWTLEKMLTDQAISELSAAVERGKEELSRAHKETERWKRACLDADIKPKDDRGSTDDDGDT